MGQTRFSVSRLAHKLAETSPDCIKVIDAEGRLQFLNEAGRVTLGFSPENWRGASWPAFWASSQHAAQVDAAFRAALSGEPSRFTAWLGARFWDVALTPYQDAEGRPYVIGISRDLTHEQAAHELLEKQSERYRLAMAATRDAIWDWDLETDEIHWGEATREAFGWPLTRDAACGAWWKANIHPEDRERIIAGIERVIQSNDVYWCGEYRFRSASNAYKHVVDRGYVIRNASGRAVRMVGAMMDLSKVKDAEQELCALTGRLQTVFETTSDGIVILDRDWRFRFLNRRAAELLDRGESLIGENVWRAFPELENSDFGQSYKRAMASGERAVVTGEYLPLGIWVEARAFPSVDGLTIFFRDITSKRNAEVLLQETTDRLRLALDAGRVVAWERDDCTRRLTFSDNACAVLGMPSSCSIEEFRERVHPDDVDLARSAFRLGAAVKFRFRDARGQIWLSARSAEGKDHHRLYGTLTDVTEQQEAQERLWEAANFDDMTGLPNRAFLQAHLQSVLEDGEPFSLLFMDLDNFKDVNDSEGHDAGDAMLKEVAQRLRSFTADGLFAARCGGDEFALIVRRRSSAEVMEMIPLLLEKMRQPLRYKHRVFDCRASIGVAHAPQDGADSFSLLKAADLALYAAKEDGRNRAAEYSADLKAGLQKRISVARQVRKAIGRDRIIPYYQPKICLRTGRIAGFEALARMVVPGRIVSAQSFAEAFAYPDIAAEITARLLDQVFAHASAWLAKGVDIGHVAINLGEADFRLNDIAQTVLGKLDEFAIPGSAVQIEVTETVFLGRAESRLLEGLHALKERGVTVALDDFGTGYASLTHLKRFPVDTVKIDQSFIRDMLKDEQSRAIASAIVGLGKCLSLGTVAEGIENHAQVLLLQEMGCETGQGYHFARPMPASDVSGWIAQWGGERVSAPERKIRRA